MQFTIKSIVYFIICKLLHILYVNKIYNTFIYIPFSLLCRMPAISWEWEAEKKWAAEVGEGQREGTCEDKADSKMGDDNSTRTTKARR